jgi:RNA recognition motif-containing protein
MAWTFRDTEWAPSSNIFVNYLPKHWTKTELVALCCPFGTIESAKVMIDLKTGASKGFGFVRYTTPESAVEALAALNGFETCGKRLLVRFTGSRENIGRQSSTIHVKSLSLTLSYVAVRRMFQPFGDIDDLKLDLEPQTLRFRGSAYVTYKYTGSAVEALRCTNNVTLWPGQWPLFVQFSEPPIGESPEQAQTRQTVPEGPARETPGTETTRPARME